LFDIHHVADRYSDFIRHIAILADRGIESRLPNAWRRTPTAPTLGLKSSDPNEEISGTLATLCPL
jgi:hypothetical protein